MRNPPEVQVWLDVPEDCRMSAQLTGDGDAQFTFGDGPFGQVMLLELSALVRLMELGHALLAKPEPADRRDRPALESPAVAATPERAGWGRHERPHNGDGTAGPGGVNLNR